MLYLLDANTLIGKSGLLPIERVAEFWEWLAAMGDRGLVKIPLEILEEIILPPPTRTDALVDWLKAHQDALLLREVVRENLVARVVEQGYGNDLTDIDVGKIGRDPFLIAYALVNVLERYVITQ